MKAYVLVLISAVFVFPLAALADDASAPQGAATERVRIDRERTDANAVFNAQEQQCYFVFAVNSCLREVGMRRIEMMSNLKRQETKLNDAQRMQQSQEQRSRMQEKAADRAAQDAQALETSGTGLAEKQAAQHAKQAAHAQKLKDASQR